MTGNTSTSGSAGRSARRTGFIGCLLAVLAGGAGVVLLALGMLPHTTEALPVGAVLTLLGVIAGMIGAVKLRRGLSTREAPGPVAASHASTRPPTTIACPSCGGAAPVCVANPQHSTCPFCRTRFALPEEIASRLHHAARFLQLQAASERHIAGSIAMLSRRQRGWTLRVLAIAAPLSMIAFLVAVFGWLVRLERSDWHAWFALGVTSAFATAALALLGVSIVPPWMRRIVGHWTALRQPGVEGLACRVCGGPLPGTSAPIIRCAYCSADNIAGSDVLARMAADTLSATRRALAIDDRRRLGEELASASLVAFPLLVFLAWFAAGAVAGSVVFMIGGAIELDPDSDERFAIVRLRVDGGAPRTCVAATRFSDSDVTLYVRAGVNIVLPRGEFARYAAGDPIAPERLVGRVVYSGYTEARVTSIYRRFAYLASHVIRTDSGSEVYLPWPEGGGALVCLDRESGPGAALPVSSGS